MSTGARNRYPRRACVSMKRGLSAESPSAWRNFAIPALRLRSKSTKVSAVQSACLNSSRVTVWPGRSNKIDRIRNGCSCSFILRPSFVSTPWARSSSKRPKRTTSVRSGMLYGKSSSNSRFRWANLQLTPASKAPTISKLSNHILITEG